LVAFSGNRLKSKVLLAPHHGSKTSSTAAFLESVKPEIVIISSGWKSRFGFPHQPVLDRYRKKGSIIFETARQGAVRVSTDGEKLTIEAQNP
ncbi:MAG: DNA internalization-related competence protein ComEC/Rec2, partial [Proteobacteria bacterium]|nr:DNA internalization-related competence protein ComEC/Rec2 [Pseudomonadota bacterium]